MWLSQLLRDVDLTKYLRSRISIIEDKKHEVDSPVQLKGNIQTSLILAKDAYIHERSKHIDIAFHFVRDAF